MSYSLLMIVGLSACLAMTVGSARADEVTYVDHEKVAAAMLKGGLLTAGSDHKVQMSRRTETGESEVHEGETDVFYILEGTATFVTGGTIEGGKTTAPGQIRGKSISGGESRVLSKGDVIVIPKGTPHWFKEVPELIVYFVVKAL